MLFERKYAEPQTSSSVSKASDRRSSGDTVVTDTDSVPSSMKLSATLQKNVNKIRKVPLITLNCSFGVVTEKPEAKSLSRTVRRLSRKQRSEVTVVFAVRKPGCGACREHGLQLTELAAEMKDVSFMGIVKETGADDAGLVEFYEDYFHFPLYKDAKWEVYRAMGSRKLCVRRLMSGYFKAKKRLADKQICMSRSFAGDTRLQGGVLIFDKNGTLRYACEENFGDELVLRDIAFAIRAVREEDMSTTAESTASSLEI